MSVKDLRQDRQPDRLPCHSTMASCALVLAGQLMAANCPADPHRLFDPNHARTVPGVTASLGGAHPTLPAGTPRFPIVAAGAATVAHPASGPRAQHSGTAASGQMNGTRSSGPAQAVPHSSPALSKAPSLLKKPMASAASHSATAGMRQSRGPAPTGKTPTGRFLSHPTGKAQPGQSPPPEAGRPTRAQQTNSKAAASARPGAGPGGGNTGSSTGPAGADRGKNVDRGRTLSDSAMPDNH